MCVPSLSLRCVLFCCVCSAGLSRANMLDITSGLNLWLRADSRLVSGATVTEWVDLTGTGSGLGDNLGQNAVLSDGSPSVVSGAVNGLNSVNFGGGGGYTFTGNIGITGTQEFTAFTVFKNESGNGTTADERIFQFGDITDNNVGRNIALDGNSPAFRYNNGNRVFNEDFTKNVFELGTWTRAAGATYGQAELSINTVAATQASAGSPGSVADLADEGYTLGRGTVSATGAAGNFMIGEVAEILLFNRQLTAFETDSVEYYLRHRYSLDFQAVEIPGLTMLSDNVSAAPLVASTVEGANESNNDGMIFQEVANLTLTTAVNVNFQGTGSFSSNFDAVVGQIAPGTTVNSYLLNLDTRDATSILTFDLQFETPVLGLIAGNNSLANSNAILGAPSTTYMSGAGLEAGSEDLVVVSPDGKTLTVTMRVGPGFVDQLRIITAAVPEPSAGVLVMFGAGLLLVRLRGRLKSA